MSTRILRTQVLKADRQSASDALSVRRARQAELLQFSSSHATDLTNGTVAPLAEGPVMSIRSVQQPSPTSKSVMPLLESNWLPPNSARLAWVLVCCAIFSTDLTAQTPKAKRAPEKQGPTSDQTDEQKTRMSEPSQPTSTAQRAEALEEQKIKASEPLQSLTTTGQSARGGEIGSPFPVKPPDASQHTGGNALQRREAAQQTLQALRVVIQSNPKSGMDLAAIKAREHELRTQLMTAKTDSEFNEVIAQAAILLAEITIDAPKSSIRPKAGNDVANQVPSASRMADASGSKIPLILSLISLAVSVAALVASLFLTRKEIVRALRSAGLQ